MKIRTRNFRKVSTEGNFWPSFTDVMSTIALILFFLMLLAFIQNIVTGKNLEYARKELQNTKNKLESSRLEINQAEKELRMLETEVKQTKAEVEEGRIQLTLFQEEIENKNNIIQSKEKELNEKEVLIEVTTEELEKQKKIIAMNNAELGNLREKLQDIALLRIGILEKVKESIVNKIGKTNEEGQPLVSIGDNANIIINESIMFDYDSSEVKPEGKKLLDQFAMAFKKILDDNEVRKNIDAIVVEGHTDSEGTSVYNRKLSAERAYNVVNYLMSANKNLELEENYGDYFSSSGYSEFRPIASNDTAEGRQKNRRIEISVVIKDSRIQDIIDNYLADTDELLDN